MEHIAAFMILIACSDDLQACNEIPAPAIAYETAQQCQAELTPAMGAISASQTRSYGKCVEIDPALFYEDAEIVWDVTHDGGLEVTLEVINPHVSIQSMARADNLETSNTPLN